nr:MAG TPA: hypothetical protein [Caudoviricetes sp.]
MISKSWIGNDFFDKLLIFLSFLFKKLSKKLANFLTKNNL